MALSSPTAFFTSAETIADVEKLISFPKDALDRENKKKARNKKSTNKDQQSKKKSTPGWSAAFCAEFIVNFNELVILDQKQKRQPQRRNRTIPQPIAKLIEMYEKAEKSATTSTTFSMQKKKDTASHPEGWKKHYLAAVPQFNIQLDDSTILPNHYCPECKHYSLAPIESNEEINAKNALIRAEYEHKLREHSAKGKQGPKPRSGKTVSQTLACFCFQQNCLGNPNGRGCFNCKNGIIPNDLIKDPK